MNKPLLILLSLAFLQCAPHKNNSSSDAIKSIVENQKTNIVYRGIKNMITIYMPDVDSFAVKGIGVRKGINENQFYIIPGRGNEVELRIDGYKSGKALSDKRIFRIFDLGKPYCSINRNFGTITMEKKDLSKSKISWYIQDFIHNYSDVLGFSVKINNDDLINITGNRFNSDIKARILNMNSGEKVAIFNVKVLPNIQRYHVKKIQPLIVIIE